jgi:hypothetical protein
MARTGILTFHYSNNYGGVLQAVALQKTLEQQGFEAEVIDFVPLSYNTKGILNRLGISKRTLLNSIRRFEFASILKKMKIARTYSKEITAKVNSFREKEIRLSKRVDENSLGSILRDYDAIVVGSDQVWNPSQRKKPYYFLDFGKDFKGRKISYAADSTTNEVSNEELESLKRALDDFYAISVRNVHSKEFVRKVTGSEAQIVADPTVLFDFSYLLETHKNPEKYILTYVLGKEISGSHIKVIEEIRSVYGKLPVYSIKIPTMNFEFSDFADKTFYNLDPVQWLEMLKNAAFVYTDSFHGTLFSLKFHKPFLSYYSENMRSTRFLDLGHRLGIQDFVVNSVSEMHEKRSIHLKPDFSRIDQLFETQRIASIDFLKKALEELK